MLALFFVFCPGQVVSEAASRQGDKNKKNSALYRSNSGAEL
jgi:hypothetical protein